MCLLQQNNATMINLFPDFDQNPSTFISITQAITIVSPDCQITFRSLEHQTLNRAVDSNMTPKQMEA